MHLKINKMIYLLVGFLSILVCTSCQCAFKDKQYSKTYFEYFDTIITVMGYEKKESAFIEKTNQIEELLQEYNQLYDIYYEYQGVNNLYTVNKQAGKEPVKVDQKIIDLIVYAKDMYEVSHHMMNIAMGPVLSLWHDAREVALDQPELATIPSRQDLEKASLCTNINDVIVDEINQTIFLKEETMSIDVGAIAKGFATEQIAKFLTQEGEIPYVINAGGNIRVLGQKPNSTNWNVGIQNPDLESSQSQIEILSIRNLAVVTSGSYQRYFTVNGKQYHHIISPITLMTNDTFVSVTVISAHSGMADALSTALFNLSLEEGIALIEELEYTEAMWIDANYQIHYSNHFKDYQYQGGKYE